MVKVRAEIRQNYHAFSKKTSTSISKNISDFEGAGKLVESYARIASINAFKLDIVEPHFPSGAADFFFEAHNDALISHVNASYGSWRSALQALRSFMENTMMAIFYLDHPVEFIKWSEGNFKLSPREIREYVSEHPKLKKVACELMLKSALDEEYATLSKAVHGSSSLFRMTTGDGKTNIANPSLADLGKWSARERSAVDICMTSLAAVASDYLDGAKMPNLRTALSVSIQKNSRAALKKHLGITIHSP